MHFPTVAPSRRAYCQTSLLFQPNTPFDNVLHCKNAKSKDKKTMLTVSVDELAVGLIDNLLSQLSEIKARQIRDTSETLRSLLAHGHTLNKEHRLYISLPQTKDHEGTHHTGEVK